MNDSRVEVGTRFELPLRDGYDYITDLERWPEYWPDLVRVAPGSRWSQPGDTATVTMKLLGRATELEMTLSRVEPYRLVEYTSRQRGFPRARHERHFAEDHGGLRYGIVIELEPRSGLRAVFDRVIVTRAVERVAWRTIRNLEQRFAEPRPGDDGPR